MEEVKLTGTVKFYNEKARFGFIRVDDTELEVYVKKSGLLEPVSEGDAVKFILNDHPKGPMASQVRLLSNDY